jgi:NAD-dependent dihydropyrimidine dehydrogenase PreA subunit
MRGITEWGIENSVARANYYAVIDPDECLNCGACIERCHVHAISELDGVSVVDRDKCIGCGLCVTGCPNEVARLERRPEAEMIQPVLDWATWEHDRLVNRGLLEGISPD